VPQSLYFRLADISDVTTLFDIRRAAIRQLSLTHLSECEAAAWAERGGEAFDRIKPDVFVVTPLLYFGSQQVNHVRYARQRGIKTLLGVGCGILREAFIQCGHSLLPLLLHRRASSSQLHRGSLRLAPSRTPWCRHSSHQARRDPHRAKGSLFRCPRVQSQCRRVLPTPWLHSCRHPMLFGGSSHAQTSCGISGLTNQCDGYTSVARCFQRQAAFTQQNAPSSFKHDGEQHDSRPSHRNLSST